MGRHDEAIAASRRGAELNPGGVGANNQLAYRLFLARRYTEAIDTLERSREMNRLVPFTHVLLAYTYTELGRYAEAISAFEEARKLGDDSPSSKIFLGMAHARAGDRKTAVTILDELRHGKAYVSPGELAVLYVALGEREQAFAALERAFVARDVTARSTSRWTRRSTPCATIRGSTASCAAWGSPSSRAPGVKPAGTRLQRSPHP